MVAGSVVLLPSTAVVASGQGKHPHLSDRFARWTTGRDNCTSRSYHHPGYGSQRRQGAPTTDPYLQDCMVPFERKFRLYFAE